MKETQQNERALYPNMGPYAEFAGIRIGVENLFQFDQKRGYYTGKARLGIPQELAAMVDELGTDCFTACVDIGHAGLCCDPADMIRYIGHRRLGALHVHDNDYHYDQHSIPYVGSLDWDAITAALREVKYTGEFALESTSFFKPYWQSGLYMEVLEFTVATSRHLIRKITGEIP